MDIVRYTKSLDVASVLSGYRVGIFPMGYPGHSTITWHRPDPRAILPLDALHVPASLARRMRRGGYSVTYDQAFTEVMRGCAERRSTWITPAFFQVYGQLAAMGRAHSIEVWVEGALAGGLYGVHIGGAFFAESMFHRVTDMSKIALVTLAQRLRERGFLLMEVQYLTPHLARFGVVEISAQAYRWMLEKALATECVFP